MPRSDIEEPYATTGRAYWLSHVIRTKSKGTHFIPFFGEKVVAMLSCYHTVQWVKTMYHQLWFRRLLSNIPIADPGDITAVPLINVFFCGLNPAEEMQRLNQ